MDKDLDTIAERILQGKKYGELSKETVMRILQKVSGGLKKPKEIEKVAKKKLHQIYGAYFQGTDTKRLEKLLQKHPEKDDSFFKEVLELHISTKERIEFLPTFYNSIFKELSPFETFIDLACGLNQFTFPWMEKIQPGVKYLGFDINADIAIKSTELFKEMGLPVEVQYGDLLNGLPELPQGNPVCFFKTLPCLEQQEKGIGKKLLRQLTDREVVLSFPAASLTGKNKGMKENYKKYLNEIIEGLFEIKATLEFPTETVYILNH